MALKTNVYVDGFNLYYGCVRGTPYKWLDVAAFCARLLPKNQINRIRYFTALVTPRANDPQQRMRQEIYLRAIRTIPNLTIDLEAISQMREVNFLISGRRMVLLGPALIGMALAAAAFSLSRPDVDPSDARPA